MNRNQVVLVDINDNAVGIANKLQAHQTGQLHRAFSIFVARRRLGKIEILLQQRAWSKYHCAGLWSNSCCSHPQPQEDLKSSALKRLQEELGFSLESIEWVGSHCYKAMLDNGLVEHEFDHLFIGWHQQEPTVNFNKDEVNAVKWLSLEEINLQIIKKPQQFTPWFFDTFSKIQPLLNSA